MVNMLAKSDHLKKAIASEVKAQVEAALSTSTLEQRLQRMSLTLKSIQKDIRQACQKLSNTRDVASTLDALVHLHLKERLLSGTLSLKRMQDQKTAGHST